MNKRILVGMSGGIDSTASCLLLQKQGYEVVGITFLNHSLGMHDSNGEPCYVTEAREAATGLGVEHHVTDVRDEFDRDVAMPFVQGWLAGLTPNPCVRCNPGFKFRLLAEWADRLACDRIATGHYAQIAERGERLFVQQGADEFKDQSYFLCRLGQDVLRRTIFPVGGMTKQQVRGFLAENGFESGVPKRESMEICFIEKDYRDYLRARVPDIDSRIGCGAFVDSGGKVIGEHKGYPYYTVGQRKGLEVAFGSPRYVLRTNPEKNTVMLGTEEQLETEYMLVEGMSLNRLEPASDEVLRVRIRYRSHAVECCVLGEVADGRTLIRFREPVSAVAPGQTAVFYQGAIVVGFAEISSQRGIRQYL